MKSFFLLVLVLLIVLVFFCDYIHSFSQTQQQQQQQQQQKQKQHLQLQKDKINIQEQQIFSNQTITGFVGDARSFFFSLQSEKNVVSDDLLALSLTTNSDSQDQEFVDIILRDSSLNPLLFLEANNSKLLCHHYAGLGNYYINVTGTPFTNYSFNVILLDNQSLPLEGNYSSSIIFSTSTLSSLSSSSSSYSYSSLSSSSSSSSSSSLKSPSMSSGYAVTPYDIFFFDVTTIDAPLEITVESLNGAPDLVAFLTASYNSCMNMDQLDGSITFLSWNYQAKLTIASHSTPSLQIGRWFFAIGPLPQSPIPDGGFSKSYTIDLSYGMPYKDYPKPLLLLFFLFPLLCLVTLLMVWLVMRYLQSKIQVQGFYLPKEKRHTEYIWYTVVSSLFFFIPAIQVAWSRQETFLGIAGDRNGCYYNEFCMRPLGPLFAFNNIWSNWGYILAGLLLIAYAKLVKQSEWKVGVPRDFSLVFALSWAIVVEGILSGVYHICPTRTIFQFDSAFMFVISGLGCMELYRKYFKRALRGSRMFLCAAVLIGINYVGSLLDTLNPNLTLNKSEIIFRVIIYVFFFLPFFILFVIRYTYYRELSSWFGPNGVFSTMTSNGLKPRHPGRLSIILILFLILTIGVFMIPDNSQMILGLMVGSLGISITAYTAQKFRPSKIKASKSSSRLLYVLWTFLTIGYLCLSISSVYFFEQPSSNKVLSPYASRDTNRDCLILDFYDSHDIWHILSAGGLFFMALLLIHFDRDERGKITRDYSNVGGSSISYSASSSSSYEQASLLSELNEQDHHHHHHDEQIPQSSSSFQDFYSEELN